MKTPKNKIIVNKSNKGIFAQLVLLSGETKIGKRYEFNKSKPPVEQAYEAGEEFGKSVIASGTRQIVFERAKSLYHGQIKAFADGLRKVGLQF